MWELYQAETNNRNEGRKKDGGIACFSVCFFFFVFVIATATQTHIHKDMWIFAFIKLQVKCMIQVAVRLVREFAIN